MQTRQVKITEEENHDCSKIRHVYWVGWLFGQV